MARTKRIKADGDAFYHVTSRITGKQYLLKDPEVKRLMLDALERAARFSGVHVGSFCIMDDHFHLLFQVPAVDVEKITDEELLERIEILSGKKRAEKLSEKWDSQRSRGDSLLVEGEQARWRRRLYDLSQFIKTFKEEFRRTFQKKYDYSGRLWGDRFYSTLVESAQYLSRCAAYVEYNPVRAGMTSRAISYAWNTSGRAQSGDAFAIACRAWLSETAGVTGGVATSGHAHQEQDHRDSPQMEKWMGRRQPQITKGCILGSSAFVNQSVARFEEKLGTRSARARLVDDVLFASHGYRLAKKERKVA